MSDNQTPAEIPAHGRVFETDSRREGLARLTEGLGAREPFLLVTGDPGTGKTLLLREVVARWGARAVVALIANSAMTRTEFLEEILRRFGLQPPAAATKPQLLDRLERHIAEAEGNGQVPVIVIDDAHEIPDELLNELRMLANASALTNRPLEIVLVGLPALEARLAEPALELVRQRVAVHFTVNPFSHHETRHYLHEVVSAPHGEGPEIFPRKSCREIFERSGGVARAINVLAGEAMSRARTSGARTVSAEDVQFAAGRTNMIRREAPAPAPQAAAPQATAPQAPTTQAAAPQAAAPRAASGSPALQTESREAPPIVRSVPIEAAATVAAPVPPAATKPVAPTPALESTGSTGKAASAPAAPEPARAIKDIAPIVAAAGPAGDAPAPGPDDARAREWIERFIKPDEPRFGELLMAAAQSPGPDAPSRARKTESEVLGSAMPRSADPNAAIEAGDFMLVRPHRGQRRGDRRGQGRGDRRSGDRRRQPAARRWPIDQLLPAVRQWATHLPTAAVRQWATSQLLPAARRWATPLLTAVARRRPNRQLLPAATALLILLAAIGLIVMPRGQRSAPRTAPASAVSATPSRAATPARSSTPGAASPSRQWFSLDVGTYPYLDQAETERDRIVAATGLKGWQITESHDGVEVHRVVVGVYSTRERALVSGSELIRSAVVSEAAVIPLPPRRLRR